MSTGHHVVAIGGSAGAIEPLLEIIGGLPDGLSAAVFVVIHSAPARETLLPDLLNRRGALPADTARHGEAIEPGRIYVAPPDMHVMIDRGVVRLGSGPKESGHRPAIDALFRTAAFAYSSRAVGVILSGNQDDGSLGLSVIRRHGGTAIVQRPQDALFADMPKNAIQAAGPQYVIPASEIAPTLAELAQREPEPQEAELISLGGPVARDVKAIAFGADDVNGGPTGMSCPDCHGVLWASPDPEAAPLVCRTGHSYSMESLVEAQASALEDAQWAALRALQEHASLTNSMAQKANRRGDLLSAKRYAERSATAREQSRLVQEMLLTRAERAS